MTHVHAEVVKNIKDAVVLRRSLHESRQGMRELSVI